MFNPALDLGADWEDVDIFSVEPNTFNRQYYTDLGFRSDALLVKVTIDIPGAEYKIAGEIFQYWQVDGNRYQVAYSKVWLNQQTVVKVESIESSLLLFKPVPYLYNWTFEIKARPYQVVNLDNSGIQALANQLQELKSLTQQGFEDLSNKLENLKISDRQQVIDLLAEIKDCACNGSDAGTGLSGESEEGKFFGAN